MASWSHIAAAPSDPISSSERSPPPPVESSDHVTDGNAAGGGSRGKKTVWNVPSGSSIEGGAVMDAEYWPALSESARVSPKPSSSASDSSLKGDASVSVHLGSVSPTSSAANAVSDRSSSGGFVPNGAPAASSPLASLSHLSQTVPDKQPSPKGLTTRNNSNSNHNWENSSRVAGASNQAHGGNEHHRSFGGGRRGNNQHSNYGNRRDHEWNHRNFVRDVHMQQMHTQWGVRPFSRPAPVSAQLIHPPPPPRPFSHNMGFPDMPSTIYYVPAPPHPDGFRGLPFGPHPVPFQAPPMMLFDPQRAMLLKQIDYYFSPENLCKDTYLRSCMDEQGWVHVSVIAGFNRVKLLTNNVQYILDTLRLSTVVEVQGDKIRRRNDWSAWVFATTGNQSGSSGSQSPTATANYDALAAQFHNIGLENNSDQSSYERIC